MTIRYKCRHCQIDLGEINEPVSEEMLGLTLLTSEERKEMIAYEANGDMTIFAICENCHEALLKNHDFSEFDQIIH